MSRPIKFRAWDVFAKEMDYEVTIDPDGKVAAFNPLDGQYVRGFSDDEKVLMQYTGLKDRNGKEIYEGDVIQMDCGCDSEYGCSHGPWHGYVKWDPETASYELRDMDGRWSGEAFEESMTDEYLVVGNIYETPLEDTP
ncbi:YopX family protein [Paenibacillus polymyxa]|uniref:YopX family protein n=1 Tax=Paenibacillus polymyxa TaxID=1406 RepID=UPI001072C859|nr:YopX family protein [Paenibacillus polymyxa]